MMHPTNDTFEHFRNKTNCVLPKCIQLMHMYISKFKFTVQHTTLCRVRNLTWLEKRYKVPTYNNINH